jgi:L-rhamnose mutarotase
MEHIMFVQKVKDDKKDQYIKYHKNCWPDLLKAIKESGIEENIIWIYGNEVFNYAVSDNFDESMKILSEKQVFKDWSEKMESLFEVKHDFLSDKKVEKLEKIFDLEEQLKQ